MRDTHDTTRRPRPAAMALAKAFDGGMTLDDLRELTDAELGRFGGILEHWWRLGAAERDRRVQP